MERIQPPSYFTSPYPPTPEMGQVRANQTNTQDGIIFVDYMKGYINKRISIFCSFTDSAEWHDEIFTGLLESVGDDYVVIYDSSLNKSILIMAVYINYIEIMKETKNKKWGIFIRIPHLFYLVFLVVFFPFPDFLTNSSFNLSLTKT